MEDKKISVKEIAEMAGTSVATVSRVINQNGRFSKATEKRVQEVIEKYGYQPNQLARGLRANRTRAVGILVPDITNEFFASITKSVQKSLLEYDYMTIICSTNENTLEARKQFKMLMSQRISGIIYIGGDNIDETIEIPTVYIDRDPRDTMTVEDDSYVMIECDNIQGGYLAGKELTEKGAKNIAVVVYKETLSTEKKRLKGFIQALEEAGLELAPQNKIHVKEVTHDEGSNAAKCILEQLDKIDGVFFMSDVLAVGGINYFRSRDIQIPEQLKVVGFDDITLSRSVSPKLTTIHQPVEEFGLLAAQRVLNMINGETIEKHRQRLPVELIVRETT